MNTIGDYVPSHPPRPILNQEKPWHVTLPVDCRHKDSLPVVVIWKFLKFIQYYTVQIFQCSVCSMYFSHNLLLVLANKDPKFYCCWDL